MKSNEGKGFVCMPLKKGISSDVVRSNIHEMVRAGHKPSQAIAAALSMKRRSKKMADGGEVEPMEGYDEKGVTFEDNREKSPEENGPYPGTIVMKKAHGGLIEGDDDSHLGEINGGDDAGKSGNATFPKDADDEMGLSEMVLAEQMLAKGLQAKRMKANDNTHDYNPFPGKEAGKEMNQGGLLVEEHVESDLGNKPELDWINDGTAEPMSSEPAKAASLDHSVEEGVPVVKSALSKEAMDAIAAKKKKRRYTV